MNYLCLRVFHYFLSFIAIIYGVNFLTSIFFTYFFYLFCYSIPIFVNNILKYIIFIINIFIYFHCDVFFIIFLLLS